MLKTILFPLTDILIFWGIKNDNVFMQHVTFFCYSCVTFMLNAGNCIVCSYAALCIWILLLMCLSLCSVSLLADIA